MRTIVTSTSGKMKFEQCEGAVTLECPSWDNRTRVGLDMTPEDVIDFIREAGQCVIDIEPAGFEHAEETLTIEVYDDYRE